MSFGFLKRRVNKQKGESWDAYSRRAHRIHREDEQPASATRLRNVPFSADTAEPFGPQRQRPVREDAATRRRGDADDNRRMVQTRLSDDPPPTPYDVWR